MITVLRCQACENTWLSRRNPRRGKKGFGEEFVKINGVVIACRLCGASRGLSILDDKEYDVLLNRMKILAEWQSCKISDGRLPAVESVCKSLLAFRAAFYDPIQVETGVPWYVVGALDYHEEGFRHDRYLGNGDPFNRPTRHVPASRGPFASWQEGAIDAIKYDHLNLIHHWDIVTALVETEIWNGLGYASRGLPSPYVWGATNVQKPGKYVADHVFDSSKWDSQIGCAAIFLNLKQNHGVDLNEG